jgi:hypothetical protein
MLCALLAASACGGDDDSASACPVSCTTTCEAEWTIELACEPGADAQLTQTCQDTLDDAGNLVERTCTGTAAFPSGHSYPLHVDWRGDDCSATITVDGAGSCSATP